MRGLVNLCDEVDEEELSGFALNRRYWSPAPRSPGRGTWPVVRLNALPLLEVPTHCRRVECEIGGTAKVREAAKDASVIAVRSRVGVLAFGSDVEVRRAFDPYGVTEFDLHALNAGSRTERGLLHDALRAALIRGGGLAALPDNRWDLVPAQPRDPCWNPLRKMVKTLGGELGADRELRWHEGISIRLEWSGDRLWLVFNARTVFEGVTDDNKAVAADFSRERTVRRYNTGVERFVGLLVTLSGRGPGGLAGLRYRRWRRRRVPDREHDCVLEAGSHVNLQARQPRVAARADAGVQLGGHIEAGASSPQRAMRQRPVFGGARAGPDPDRDDFAGARERNAVRFHEEAAPEVEAKRKAGLPARVARVQGGLRA